MCVRAHTPTRRNIETYRDTERHRETQRDTERHRKTQRDTETHSCATCTHMHARMHKCTHTHMHARTHARMHARTHECTRAHTHTHARMHACTHVHACTRACMHSRTLARRREGTQTINYLYDVNADFRTGRGDGGARERERLSGWACKFSNSITHTCMHAYFYPYT